MRRTDTQQTHYSETHTLKKTLHFYSVNTKLWLLIFYANIIGIHPKPLSTILHTFINAAIVDTFFLRIPKPIVSLYKYITKYRFRTPLVLLSTTLSKWSCVLTKDTSKNTSIHI